MKISFLEMGRRQTRLEQLEKDRNVAGLLEALEDLSTWRNLSVAGEAAFALGRLGATEHAVRIRPLLASPDWPTRFGALCGLELLKDRDSASDVVRLLDDEKDAVRAAAAVVLGEVGDPKALGPLRDRAEREIKPTILHDIREAIAKLAAAEGERNP